MKRIHVIIYVLCILLMFFGLWRVEKIKNMEPDPVVVRAAVDALNQQLGMKGLQLFQRIEDAQNLLKSSGERFHVQLVEPPANWKPTQFYYTFVDLSVMLETGRFGGDEEIIYEIITFNPEMSVYGASPSKTVEENDRILIESGFHHSNGFEMGYLSMGEDEVFTIEIENYDDSMYKSEKETSAKSVISVKSNYYPNKMK